jgi:hypothetical protein
MKGPAISPTTFVSPRPCSINNDAHCAIVNSDAAPQIISNIQIINKGDNKVDMKDKDLNKESVPKLKAVRQDR